MAFKMRGFSPFTKHEEGHEDEKKHHLKSQKKSSVTHPTEYLNKVKEELYSLDDPNGKRAKQLQAILDKAGVDWKGMNADEVD